MRLPSLKVGQEVYIQEIFGLDQQLFTPLILAFREGERITGVVTYFEYDTQESIWYGVLLDNEEYRVLNGNDSVSTLFNELNLDSIDHRRA